MKLVENPCAKNVSAVIGCSITGLSRVFNIYDSVDEALASHDKPDIHLAIADEPGDSAD